MVVLLTVAYVFSFIDRYIISLLVEPIKADLGLSDTQMGILLGPAFAFLYAIAGLPLGWLADRYRRNVILGVGVALWSIATAASALAKNFLQLFTARIGVGVGEASLAPCALSLISDSFPVEERGRPVAFYTAAQSLGAGLAFLGGGAVFAWAVGAQGLSWPWLGPLKPWQTTFVVVGLPGLLIALLLFALREPARQERAVGQSGASVKETLHYIRTHLPTYASFIAFPMLMTTVAYSQNWFPAMFERTWSWPIARYALWSGIALMILGPLTVNLAGWLSDRLSKAGRRDGPMLVMLAGSFLLVIAGTLAPLMPTGEMAFMVWLFCLIGMSTVSAASPIAMLNIAPGPMRGQLAALFYMFTSLTGLIVGPMAVALLTDNIFGETNLRHSAAVVPILFGLPVLALTLFAQRRYATECERIFEQVDNMN